MSIRLPGSDQEQSWSGKIVADPFARLTPGARDRAERLQAADDAHFVATGLAGLQVAYGAPLDGEDSDRAAAFQQDVEGRVRAGGKGSGSSPSRAAQKLFRRRAEALGQGLSASDLMTGERARVQALNQEADQALDGLAAQVAANPALLTQALARSDDVIRASAPFRGDEDMAILRSGTGQRLGRSAIGALLRDDPEAARDALNTGDFDSLIGQDAVPGFLASADDAINAKRIDTARDERAAALALVKQRDADAFRFESTFIDNIEAGTARLGDLTQARLDGVITRDRAQSLQVGLEAAELDHQRRATGIARVSEALSGGAKLDPASDQDRAAAESWFQDVIAPGLSELEPIERIGILRRVPDAIGIIPENAICPLAGMALSGPAEQRVAAAGAIGGLINKYHHARDCVPQPVQQIVWVVEALGPMQLPAAEIMQAAEAVPLSVGSSDGGGAEPEVLGIDADGKDGEDVQVAGVLGKILEKIIDGFAKKTKPPGRTKRGQGNKPTEEPEAPGLPPLPPLPPGVGKDGERPENDAPKPFQSGDAPPGPGHNGPPDEPLFNTPPVGEQQDNEIAPKIIVRGNPKSPLWNRFTGAIDRLKGPTREAIEGLVHGGELTTRSGADENLNNITRRGGLKKSVEEYNKSVKKAGGNPDKVVPRIDAKDNEARVFNSEDGTTFIHRITSTENLLTVEIQIRKNLSVSGNKDKITEVFKIRFKEP